MSEGYPAHGRLGMPDGLCITRITVLTFTPDAGRQVQTDGNAAKRRDREFKLPVVYRQDVGDNG